MAVDDKDKDALPLESAASSSPGRSLTTFRPPAIAQEEAEAEVSVETSEKAPGRILMVEDNESIARLTYRILENAGFFVEHAPDTVQATERLMATPFDAVLSDIMLPGASGLELLQTIRAYDLDLPVVLMTGNPAVETAIEAVEFGAMQYLVKPVDPDALVAALKRAVRLHRMARIKRDALKLTGMSDASPGDKAGLEARFNQALDGLWMAFQPIVDLKKNVVFGYEALMRSREPSMRSPSDVLAAAERLERIYDLGARVRQLACEPFIAQRDKSTTLFLNLHTSELLDPSLYGNDSPLMSIADRIVLEITERSAIDNVKDVKARASVLRFHGFRLAIDDLGAGYAGLTSFVTLEPEVVKIDMSLVRQIDRSPIRQKLVRSVVDLCDQLNMRVVAEGIETYAELHAVRMLGCDFAQGFLIGKPSKGFLTIDELSF